MKKFDALFRLWLTDTRTTWIPAPGRASPAEGMTQCGCGQKKYVPKL